MTTMPLAIKLRPAERISFLLRIFKGFGWDPVSSLASLHGLGNYYFKVEVSHEGYWYETWGGTYDAPTTTDISLFIERRYTKVPTIEALQETDAAFTSQNDCIYFRARLPAWSYPAGTAQVSGQNVAAGYSTGARSSRAARDSDDRIEDEQGTLVRYPARLEFPSLNQRLSGDAGQLIQNAFSATISNDDGENDFLMADALPVRISKATVNEPRLADFQTIMDGVIEDVNVTREKVIIKAAGVLRNLDAPACRTFTQGDFPEIDEKTVGKLVPIGWGTLRGAKLFKVNAGKYFCIDPEYIESVQAVYDRDGKSLPYRYSNGIISTTTDASTADIRASRLRLGEIVTAEMAKANIAFAEGVWDVSETQRYTRQSPYISYIYKGKNIKGLLTELLKNDLVYLITKNDGRLSLRRVLDDYSLWICESWLITSFPEKKYSDKKMFASAVRTEYAPENGELARTYFDQSKEAKLYAEYQKMQTLEFKSHCEGADIKRISDDRYAYYGRRRERQKLGLGADISRLSLLDVLDLELRVNGRLLSRNPLWRVIEINPAQDALLLEDLEENGGIWSMVFDKIDEFNKATAALRKEIQRNSSEMATLNTTLGRLETKSSELGTEQGRLNEDVARLQDQSAVLQGMLDNLNKQTADLDFSKLLARKEWLLLADGQWRCPVSGKYYIEIVSGNGAGGGGGGGGAVWGRVRENTNGYVLVRLLEIKA